MILRLLFTVGILLYPFVLNSADIYTSASGKMKIVSITNGYLMSSDPKLSTTLVAVHASNVFSDIALYSSCIAEQERVYEAPIENAHVIIVFRVRLKQETCHPYIFAMNGVKIFTDTKKVLSLQSESDLISHYSDFSSDDLVYMARKEAEEERLLAQSIETTRAGVGSLNSGVVARLYLSRDMYRVLFLRKALQMKTDILLKRDNLSYASPVKDYLLPTKNIRLPGASRSYRKETTDGIHRGWDIMAPYGTPVQATADGVIIRIVSDWTWNDFNRLKRGVLSVDEKLQNLDVYRGNQVWLKMLDGNVVFYSHLSAIDPGISVGKIVRTGDILGNIGTSGVPEKNYRDVHLHFEIQKNPHSSRAYDSMEIMRWDFIGKDQKPGEILELQKHLFGKHAHMHSHE